MAGGAVVRAFFQKYRSRKEAQKAQKQTGQSSYENAFIYPDFLCAFCAFLRPQSILICCNVPRGS
jgi:hypothetical protein